MARDFDGTSDKIYYDDVPQVGNGSIVAWINAGVLPSAGQRDVILTFAQASEGEPTSTHDKTIFVDPSGITKVRIYDGASKIAANTTAISAGTWAHVGMTIDGSNIRAWMNGTNEGTTAAGSSYTGYSDPLFALCRDVDALGDGETDRERFDGSIAEVGVWSEVLTAAEMLALARGMSPQLIRPSALEVYLPLVRNTENRVRYDVGTVTGTTVVAHPRVINPSRRKISVPTAAAGDAVPQVWAQYRARRVA